MAMRIGADRMLADALFKVVRVAGVMRAIGAFEDVDVEGHGR
jgi:hypothetical protein